MLTSLLRERIEWLERELPPNPPRFKIYDDLPFAILRYEPEEEWALRREVRHLATRLANKGQQPVVTSLAEVFWEAVESVEGLGAVVSLERSQGFEAAQEQIKTYLADEDFYFLPKALADRLSDLDPDRHICLLTRAASLAPGFYSISALLEQMHGRTRVPTVVFYPGHLEGANTLRFMGLADREPAPTYRVKIYG